jgi:hypothetical protein
MEAAIIENTKICTGCKKEMLATKEFFYIKKTGKYGLTSICKQCEKAISKKYREENLEKVKQKQKEWRNNNSEKLKKKRKEYRKNNIEEIKENLKKYYKNNAAKIKERSEKYRENNPEKFKEKSKKYYHNNPERYKEQNKKAVQDITDSYISNCLKKPLNHLNPQVIETRRLIILIKRELRKNNFKTLETMQEDSTNKNNSQMENNLKENDNKRDLNFEVKNSDDLNKMLSGFLMDVRRGSVTHYSANSINLVADKINKNNLNQLEYKRLSGGNKKIDFFEKE